MVLSEEITGKIYDLIEGVNNDGVLVKNKIYTVNALTLLRDAVLDLRFQYITVQDYAAKRAELMMEQVSKESFSGELHDRYHVAAGQLRSAVTAIYQQGKRALNSSSYVLDSFLPHGVPIKSGSFGRQYISAQKINLDTLDGRSRQLIELIKQRGGGLEEHNDTRDKYFEHAAPATKRKQSRPVLSEGGVQYASEIGTTEVPGELLLGGTLAKDAKHYILMQEGTEGDVRETYHVHVGRVLIGNFATRTARPLFFVQSPVDDPSHFRKYEPHTHSISKTEDVPVPLYAGLESTEFADIKDMVQEYFEYIDALLAIALQTPDKPAT